MSRKPPGIAMLWRGGGSVCRTAKYQKTICTSCGVLRTNSMKASATLRTSQLTDSRMMPTRGRDSVAATMPIAETSRVLSKLTSKRLGRRCRHRPGDEMKGDVEVGAVEEEAEAELHVPAREIVGASEVMIRRPPTTSANRKTHWPT